MKVKNLPTKPSDYVSYKMDWNSNLEKYNPTLFTEMQKVKNSLHSFVFYPFQSLFKFPVTYAVADPYRSEDELKCIRRVYEKVWFEKTIKPETYSKRNLWKLDFPTKSSISSLREAFKPVDFTVTTPDNVNLRGTIFHKSQKPNAKTLLVCTGRSQIYQQGSFSWLFKLLKLPSFDFNIVMYNPRGSGDSKGEPSYDGFLIDAETIYQYIHTQLGVEEDNIDIYGYSLGGTTAVRLKALHNQTKGKIIHERSFVDSNKQLYYFLADRVGDNLLAAFLATIIGWIVNLLGWSGSILEDWKTIESKKLILAHENDPIIPYKASLLYAVKELNLDLNNTETILLKAKDDRDHLIDHHNESLSNYCDPLSNKCALSKVGLFLKT